MSSKRYQVIHKKLTDEQLEAIHKCWLQGVNHDGHTWVTWTDVEELICDLLDKEFEEKYWEEKYEGLRTHLLEKVCNDTGE